MITGNNGHYIAQLITQLGLVFEMKNLGFLHHFPGLEVSRESNGLFLSQSKYATDLLKCTSMLDCKRYGSPYNYKHSHTSADAPPLSDPSLYRSITAALQYLTLTRPDLAFAVNQACLQMHRPTTASFSSLKRILRYPKGPFLMEFCLKEDL